MKFKIYPFVKSLLFIALVAVAFTSCKKDDPDPEYVGNWFTTGKTQIDGNVREFKELITLTKTTYSDLLQIKDPEKNEWIDYLGFKGTMTITGLKLNVTLNEAGLSTFDIAENPTGEIKYYKRGDQFFTQFMEYIEMPETLEGEYQVDGNELTLKSDLNDDGDYIDEGETTTYTRQ
jgi:hypothetical protein